MQRTQVISAKGKKKKPHCPSVLFRRRSSTVTSRAIQLRVAFVKRVLQSRCQSSLPHRSNNLDTRNDRVVRTQKRAIFIAFAISPTNSF